MCYFTHHKSFDVAILPAGMLSKLYGKSKGNLVEVSPITLDVKKIKAFEKQYPFDNALKKSR